MYIIIIGGGRLGFYLAQLLLDENHDPVIIDKSPDVCSKITEELEVLAINGDATNPSTLDKAGLKEADAVVVLTAQDEVNLLISLLAKNSGAKMVGLAL